jgi:hypothetical protein
LSTIKPSLETKCLSSLSKVFADEELRDQPIQEATALLNETYSFQIAFRPSELMKAIQVHIVSPLEALMTIRMVGLVPSEMPCFQDHDEHILRSTPGLYPDPLYPLDPAMGVTAIPGQWRAVWLTVELQEQVKPGLYPIDVKFESRSGESFGQESFRLEVLPALLPKQKLIHTEWFHADCLASFYDVEVFSEMHWQLIDKFVQTAVKHGINMILTPLFTPPLDTEVGGERPTVQLVDVEKCGETYRFSFDRLLRWVQICQKRGVEYFEFSHLFTQWGAKHAPKVEAYENGELKKIFGLETDAKGEEYRKFLHEFLPELVQFIGEHNLQKCSYFHISDEPTLQHLESYRSASEFVSNYLKDFPVIDALSDYAFYEKGLVKNPIPANDHIEEFLKHQVLNLWTYYCCGQYKEVSNRFFNMPSVRNRILGMQLYKYNIVGFLHWGYNFYYSSLSKKQINPYQITDALHAFPSGDAFLVYPGNDGPIESIRLEVLYEALQDVRALQLLESFVGKRQVVEWMEEDLNQEITFSEYPTDAEWLLSKREFINQKIAVYLAEARRNARIPISTEGEV